MKSSCSTAGLKCALAVENQQLGQAVRGYMGYTALLEQDLARERDLNITLMRKLSDDAERKEKS